MASLINDLCGKAFRIYFSGLEISTYFLIFLYLLGKHLKKKNPHQSTLPLHEFVRLYILKHIVSLKLYLYLMYMGDLLHVYVK